MENIQQVSIQPCCKCSRSKAKSAIIVDGSKDHFS